MIPDQFGALGILKAMQKNSIKFMPIIGWNFWFTENIFLARNAQRDIKKIQDGIDELVNSKKPFWMTLYVMDRNNTISTQNKEFSFRYVNLSHVLILWKPKDLVIRKQSTKHLKKLPRVKTIKVWNTIFSPDLLVLLLLLSSFDKIRLFSRVDMYFVIYIT